MTLKLILITHLSWGRMEITLNDQPLLFKDCKVWPGGAKEWDWHLTGTRHQPGIQPADIEEILAQGVEMIILSRGMDLMLHTCPETEDLFPAKGLPFPGKCGRNFSLDLLKTCKITRSCPVIEKV